MNIREKLTNALALPKEITLDAPLLIATGRSELNIENYKNLLEFSDKLVRVHTKTGLLVVEGSQLVLKQITSENLLVTGDITVMRWQ
jgi:sporulation protein YqfC